MKSFKILKKQIFVMIVVSLALFACKNKNTVEATSNKNETSIKYDMQVVDNDDETVKISDVTIERDSKFGCVNVCKTKDEFTNDGFDLGDSVDVMFSNGYALYDIPYYNGFYVNTGDLLVLAYPDAQWVAVIESNGDSLWDYAKLDTTDTVTIELREKGKYKNIQESLDLGKYSSDRNDYPSDEAFVNFRNVKVGKLKENILYRGASPINNLHGRAKYADRLIKDVDIKYDIDLSDSDDEIKKNIESNDFDSEHFKSLYDTGKVAALSMNVNYRSEEFSKKVAKAMTDMARSEGANYVHCVEGKDRTGFVLMVAEGLAGATYDEIVDDYMITYENYYGVNKINNKEKYDAIKNVYIDGMLKIVSNMVDSNNDKVALKDIDFESVMRKYLTMNGMTEDDIEAWNKKFIK